MAFRAPKSFRDIRETGLYPVPPVCSDKRRAPFEWLTQVNSGEINGELKFYHFCYTYIFLYTRNFSKYSDRNLTICSLQLVLKPGIKTHTQTSFMLRNMESFEA